MTDFSNTSAAFKSLQPRMRFDVEEVWAIALKSNLQEISSELVFRGHTTGCLIHPREIFRFAIRHGAVSLIIAHSHPSGDPTPSRQDLTLTKSLFDIGRFVGIPLLDHLVICENDFFSMAAHGYFHKWSKRRPHWAGETS